MQTIFVNDICKVYNNKKLKLCVVKEIIDKEYCIVQGIFSKMINVEYKVKMKDLEKISLLYELNLINENLKRDDE